MTDDDLEYFKKVAKALGFPDDFLDNSIKTKEEEQPKDQQQDTDEYPLEFEPHKPA